MIHQPDVEKVVEAINIWARDGRKMSEAICKRMDEAGDKSDFVANVEEVLSQMHENLGF